MRVERLHARECLRPGQSLSFSLTNVDLNGISGDERDSKDGTSMYEKETNKRRARQTPKRETEREGEKPNKN